MTLTPSVCSAELYAALGESLTHQGDRNAAIAAYSQALILQPHQPQIHRALGVIYGNQQKWALAICHYEVALRQRPDWFDVLFRLARAFHRLGESAQAMSVYKQVVSCRADCGEAYVSMGVLHEQSGDYRAAIRCYRQAVFARPSYVEAHERLGEVLVRIGAYASAETVYQQAIASSLETVRLYNGLGHLKLAQVEIQPAFLAYRQAIALDPTSSTAYKSLGGLYHRYKSPERAAKYFQQAVEHAPNSATALSSYAWLLAEQGCWTELLICFRQVCVAQPNFVDAYCQQIKSLTGDDLLFRLQRASAELLRSLLQIDSADLSSLLPQLAQVYGCLGDLSNACNAPTRAEQCYRFALTLVPRAYWYEALGDCLLSQSRQAAAIAVYQAGLLQGLEDSLLAEKLDQAINRPTESSAVAASGVYRYAQDWLAHNDLAPARLNAEPFVPVGATNGLAPGCGGLTCQRCMNNLVRKFSPIQVVKGVLRCRPAEPDENLAFPAFVATIPHGRAWVVPQQNDWTVCDEVAIFSPDNFLLGDLSRYYPWYLPGCDRHDIANHTVLQRTTPLPAVEQIPGRVAVLSGLSSHIYYHWLFDVLPRFKILQKGISAALGETLSLQKSLEQIDYFVVNSLSQPFQKETLAALGVPLEKVIESDRTPHIQAEELLVPSFAGHMDWVPPSSIDFLRQIFLRPPPTAAVRIPINLFPTSNASTSALSTAHSSLPKDVKKTPPTNRIYISRSNAKYRHIFNEDAVVALLSQYGFVSVALETLSVAQQATLFSEAEAIIGAHGSGLTNLVFCSPGTVVVELFSPYYLRTDYWMISQYLQLHHYYMVGKRFTFQPLRQLMYPSGLTEDFSVDVNALRSLLKKLNLTPS